MLTINLKSGRRITTSRDAAHAFFYTEAESARFASGMSVRFDSNFFYSYATVIAARVEGKDGRPVYLISSNSMTRTTAKHLCYLRSACPCDYIRVPFHYGDAFHKPGFNMLNLLADRFKERLQRAAEARLTRAENRRALIDCYKDAKKFSERVFTLDFLGDFSDAYAAAVEIEESDKGKRTALIKAAAEKAKAARAALIEKHGYMGAVMRAYTEGDDKARRLLDPTRELSFVWRDKEGDYRTSQHICMDRRAGDAALKLWTAGKLRHGMKIGIYTVISITRDFVKIGCHKIPTENLRALVA